MNSNDKQSGGEDGRKKSNKTLTGKKKNTRKRHTNGPTRNKKDGDDKKEKRQGNMNEPTRKKKNGYDRKEKREGKNDIYPRHWRKEDCLKRYNSKDSSLIQGVVRALPGRDSVAFCTCNRGTQTKDVLIEGTLERNRALHGDLVFVELLPLEGNNDDDIKLTSQVEQPEEKNVNQEDLAINGKEINEGEQSWWQDDPTQMSLWAPVVIVQRKKVIPKESTSGKDGRTGRVVYVVPPKEVSSEINPTRQIFTKFKKIVGTLKRLDRGITLLTCSNKSLPQFKLCKKDVEIHKDSPENALFQAKYAYGSWGENMRWPPCTEAVQFGLSCNIEDETTALLIENQVDHGEHPANVLEECHHVVASGEYVSGNASGWKPTPEMYQGRKDYRSRRIFTIDPTTAKDLDDALHIEELDNGQIEIGVHIADVSFFIPPNSSVDIEAQRRCTTVYLVDRTIPMLPRPLCEIACSLNENVERLAFSCVWKMNRDGSLVKGETPWYGRTVIKSCARLDYATAQNIIENKVAFGENMLDEELWPKSRRPTGKHTIDQVAADVRLMNQIAQARRSLRFQNGAITLSAVKLSFQLDGDGETPLLCKPYVIRDSNKLVEEYMLLANFLVAQRLITHAGGLALLRSHDPPQFAGLEKVADICQTIGFPLDISSSNALQQSLNRLGRQCQDELVLQCITEMLKLPMTAATYIAAGTVLDEAWAHFALNIPYYTHFTSPIRRYADVIVHRLLQATLEGKEAVDIFSLGQKEVGIICERCNDKKEGSRKAQERSDVVFLALYLRRNPMRSTLGVVMSIGQKTFTVFIPSLGLSSLVFLDEHKDWINFETYEHLGKERRIRLERSAKHKNERWTKLVLKTLTKIRVTCQCQEKPPIGVKLIMEGPWTDDV